MYILNIITKHDFICIFHHLKVVLKHVWMVEDDAYAQVFSNYNKLKVFSPEVQHHFVDEGFYTAQKQHHQY